jgi:hypothetical protein
MYFHLGRKCLSYLDCQLWTKQHRNVRVKKTLKDSVNQRHVINKKSSLYALYHIWSPSDGQRNKKEAEKCYIVYKFCTLKWNFTRR